MIQKITLLYAYVSDHILGGDSSSSSNTGAIVGGVVGGIIAVIIIIVIIVAVYIFVIRPKGMHCLDSILVFNCSVCLLYIFRCVMHACITSRLSC